LSPQAPGIGSAAGNALSAGKPGTKIPGGWSQLNFGTNKPATEYTLGDDEWKIVLRAHAAAASRGLRTRFNFDVRNAPVLRVAMEDLECDSDADNRTGAKEDSPARIVLGFDGDKSKLGFKDKAASSMAKARPAASCHMRSSPISGRPPRRWGR
jgi:hypothetical protein